MDRLFVFLSLLLTAHKHQIREEEVHDHQGHSLENPQARKWCANPKASLDQLDYIKVKTHVYHCRPTTCRQRPQTPNNAGLRSGEIYLPLNLSVSLLYSQSSFILSSSAVACMLHIHHIPS